MPQLRRISEIILIALIIIPCIIGQSGGGGGGGGGSSSSYSSTRYYSNGSGKTCQNNCNGDQGCIEKCRRDGMIAGITIGSFFGILILTVFGVICCKKHGKCQSCCSCSCGIKNMFKYWKLKTNNNKVDSENMSQEQYIIKRNYIISLFAQSKIREISHILRIQLIIKHKQLYKQQNSKNSEQKYNQMDMIIQVIGSAKVVSYAGTERYLFGIGNRQTGDCRYLIYESNKVDKSTGIYGKWFYVGFQQSYEYHGSWKIIDDEDIQLSSNQFLSVVNPEDQI